MPLTSAMWRASASSRQRRDRLSARQAELGHQLLDDRRPRRVGQLLVDAQADSLVECRLVDWFAHVGEA